jgi:2-oxoglutarate ferredoxin oxidoreductase subunit delta
MAKVIGDIKIDVELCKGCELCIVACKEDSIGLSDTINNKGFQFAVTVNEECNGCTSCAIVCPEGIITVYRKKIK